MRVLLAIDGSESSAAACQLTASLPWPSGSIIHVVGVTAEEDADWFGNASTDLGRAVIHAVDQLHAAGLASRRLVVAGRPARLIVDVATDLRAELVIVGSRGRGPLTSMVLGSVSAEVVDHAPCPVLVVRTPPGARPTGWDRVLVAVDGSTSARAAVDYLASTRFLARSRLEVLSVAPGLNAVTPVLMNALQGIPRATPAADVLEDRLRAEMHAATSAVVLARSGHDVRWSVAVGGAAHEILVAAEAFGSALIVMGSRGLSGLSRLVLGSVARNVLLHAPTSVLIVHEPVREGSPERVEAPRRVAVSAERS